MPLNGAGSYGVQTQLQQDILSPFFERLCLFMVWLAVSGLLFSTAVQGPRLNKKNRVGCGGADATVRKSGIAPD